MSFLPGTFNLSIYQNATFTWLFIWTTNPCCGQGTVNATPQPVDLTGYTATMQFRPYNNDTAPLYYDASSNITLGGIAGTISLTIPASVTGTFTWPSALYDLLLTDSSGNVYPLLTGIVTVTPAVST